MAYFMTSTHRTNWIFTPQDINDKYKAANQRAKNKHLKRGAITIARMAGKEQRSFLCEFAAGSYLESVLVYPRYLRSVLSRHHPAHTISELTASINAIDSLIGKLMTPTSKDVKHFDRKLKSCLEPGSHDKSKNRKHRFKDSSNVVMDMS